MGASFSLVLKAHIKRSSFYILISIFVALCVLGALYDIFSLEGVSTLSSEVYAGLALLLSVCVPLFCLSDFLEREKEEGTFDLTLTRPVNMLKILIGRFLGAWIATVIALVVLCVSYYISAAVFGSYISPSSHFVLPLAFASAATSCSIALLFSQIGGFVAVSVSLFAFLVASHIIAYYSQSAQSLNILLILLPNFHLANLQNECATSEFPAFCRILFSVVSNIAYAGMLLLLGDIFISLRQKPAE